MAGWAHEGLPLMRPSPLKTVARAALAAVRERSAELCKLKPEILRNKRSCIASVCCLFFLLVSS